VRSRVLNRKEGWKEGMKEGRKEGKDTAGNWNGKLYIS
jgi:hypothetical protein